MADVSVRPTTPAEAPDLARIQAAVWSMVHAGVAPPELLEAVGGAESVEAWRTSVASPPSARHRVMTALDGTRVVGFAAIVPATDPDLDPVTDAELLALCVDPPDAGHGHGSRLVNAAADLARDAGFTTMHTWVADAESALRAFLTGAGWGADGAARTLDLRDDGEVVVAQTRLGAALPPA